MDLTKIDNKASKPALASKICLVWFSHSSLNESTILSKYDLEFSKFVFYTHILARVWK